jgi:hypothetical protein
MRAPIIPFSGDSQNSFPANLTDADSFLWSEQSTIIGYTRTSPNQSGEQRTGNYQTVAIVRLAGELGLPVAGIYAGIGCDGRSIGRKSTPQLIAAIEHASRLRCPIVAFDWQRLCRASIKLARYPVDFVSIVPLSTDPDLLPGIRKREANRENQAGRGGRPRDMQSAFALPSIMSQLGRSWASIAAELGDGWSDNKVKRLFARYFRYVDTLTTDPTKLPSEEKR